MNSRHIVPYVPKIDPATSNLISKLIDAWLSGKHPSNQLGANTCARACGGLPIYGDIGGTLFIRSDGEILSQSNTHEETPSLETNPEWRLVAIVSAVRKFPALGVLLPAPSKGARLCPDCNGTGYIVLETKHPLNCSICHGLGWANGAL